MALPPLAIYMMLDSSGSMEEGTGTGSSKWQAVQQAVRGFLAEPANTGLSMGLQFFPLIKPGSKFVCTSHEDCGPDGGPCFLSTCLGQPDITLCTTDADCPVREPADTCVQFGLCENSPPDAPLACVLPSTCADGLGRCLDFERTCTRATQCDAAAYAAPAVEIAPLAQQRGAIEAALSAQPPQGLTPTVPALRGAVDHAREWAITHPEQRVVTLLVTDGLPTECEDDAAAAPPLEQVLAIAAAALEFPQSIRTFVVGVFEPGDAASISNVDAIAAAGGTSKGVFVNTSGDVSAQFAQALRTVSSSTEACQLAISSTGGLDFFHANLELDTGQGTRMPLEFTGALTGCSTATDGWYYDVDPAQGVPSTVQLCPDTCQRLQALPVAGLLLEVGCSN